MNVILFESQSFSNNFPKVYKLHERHHHWINYLDNLNKPIILMTIQMPISNTSIKNLTTYLLGNLIVYVLECLAKCAQTSALVTKLYMLCKKEKKI